MVSKLIRNLDLANQAEVDELVRWLEINVGPEIQVPCLSWNFFYKKGVGWYLYHPGPGYSGPCQVSFDARRIKRHQYTWFRMKWL